MVIPEGYKKTEVGIIPEDWDCKRINEFAHVCMCKRVLSEQTSLYYEIPFYKIGTFGKKPDAYIPRKLFLNFKEKYSYPEKGDVLISAAGTLGRTMVFDGKDAYFQDSNIVWLKIDKRIILNEYLFFCFQVIKWTPSEGSTILRLYNGIIESTRIALPLVTEQKRIAKVLSDIDILIDSLEKLIEKKKNIKQGAMQELLTGKCRLSGFSKAWKIEPLFLLCTKITDGSHESPLESRSNYYMPSVKDMTSRGFDYSGCKQISKVDYERLVQNGCEPIEGDVLIAKDGSILKHVFVYKETKHTVILSSIAIIRPDSRKIYGQFLAHFFRQSIIVDNVIRNNKTGTGVPRIVLENFKRVPISYPPTVEEQKAISSILDAIDNEINALEKKLAKYRYLKQGMMSELLTGHIRLTEKEDA